MTRRLLIPAVFVALLLCAVGVRAAPDGGSEQSDGGTTVQPYPVAAKASGPVGLITVDGSINPGSADYIIESVKWAETERLAALVVALDTPGGLLNATRDIVQSLLGAKIPTLVFVSPSGAHAGSAGVFITMAGHIAAMAPGTNIGAAHPVTGGGKDPEQEGGEHMAAKVENDTVAFVQSIAEQRKRNAQWAESAVRKSVSITADEAVRLNVIDFVATDVENLLHNAHGKIVSVDGEERMLALRDARIIERPMSFKQEMVNTFADPNIAYILLTLGMLGLLAELYHPGTLFPGVLGAICLLLGFVSMQVLPISYGAVALLLLGIALLVAEVFTPTYGVLGVGGVVGMVLGASLMIDGVHPDFSVDRSYSVSWWTIGPTTAGAAAFILIVGYLVVRTGKRRAVTGREGMQGAEGEAIEAVGPGGGRVFVHGEYWNARSKTEIAAGSRVRVLQVNNLMLEVEAASGEGQTT